METWLLILIIALSVLLCLTLCCVLPCVCYSSSNNKWREATVAKYVAVSEVAQTARGPVEYSKKGQAPYILCVHGAPGSHDGVSGTFDIWAEQGFGIVCPSRPGYGRTPVENGKTFADAADTLVALMDTLNINEFAVLAISAGGPTGYQIAHRHQDRVKCLVTEVAITGSFNHPYT